MEHIDRFSFLWSVVRVSPWKWLLMIPVAGLPTLQAFREELPVGQQARWRVWAYLPESWEGWTIIALVVAIVLLTEGAYQVIRAERRKAASVVTAPDFAKWDNVYLFPLWQAAFLWIKEEPGLPREAARTGSNSNGIWERLRKAAINGQLAKVDDSDNVITVHRDELRRYAEACHEQPDFLYPEARRDARREHIRRRKDDSYG